MHTCAIDIHHHYMPPGLIEELKAHGETVGTEVGRTPEGLKTLTIGSGPIAGFAVTLSIGIITSMFTAIFGSRLLVHLIYGRGRLEKVWI